MRKFVYAQGGDSFEYFSLVEIWEDELSEIPHDDSWANLIIEPTELDVLREIEKLSADIKKEKEPYSYWTKSRLDTYQKYLTSKDFSEEELSYPLLIESCIGVDIIDKDTGIEVVLGHIIQPSDGGYAGDWIEVQDDDS